jgi:hypothetical protein
MRYALCGSPNSKSALAARASASTSCGASAWRASTAASMRGFVVGGGGMLPMLGGATEMRP